MCNNETDLKSIGERIKKARKSLNMTQDELAAKLYCKREVVSYYESGSRDIKTDTLVKLSKILNVSVDYLLGISKVSTTDTKLKEICEYTGLSENAVKNLRSEDGKYQIEYVNYLIEFGFIRGFFSDFALFVNSDNLSIPKSSNDVQELFDDNISDDEFLSRANKYLNDDENFTRNIYFRCKKPLTFITEFNSSMFEKIKALDLQDKLRMMKDDILGKYAKDGVNNVNDKQER